jgi:hypothetical protein
MVLYYTFLICYNFAAALTSLLSDFAAAKKEATPRWHLPITA